jgi:hypothetical protein
MPSRYSPSRQFTEPINAHSVVPLAFLLGLSSKSDPELDCSCAAFRLTPRFEGDDTGVTAFTALLMVFTILRVRAGIFRSLESG